MNPELALSDFALTLSVLIFSSFIIEMAVNRNVKKNLALTSLLFFFALYSAATYIYFHINNPIEQRLSGLAGVGILISITRFLHQFPRRKKAARWLNYHTAFCGMMAILAIYPGFFPDIQVVGDALVSRVNFATYLMNTYALVTIIIIVRDAISYRARRYRKLRQLVLGCFLLFALTSTVLLFTHFFYPATDQWLVALGPGSSIIFGFGLYLAVKKSEGELLPASLPQLLTIF